MVSWWSFLILCLFETRFGIIQFSGFSFQVSFYGFLWVFLKVWELFCVIWKSWVVDLEISNTHQACNWISEIDARRAFQRNPSWSNWQDFGKFGTEVDHLAVLLSCVCSTCLKIFLKDKKFDNGIGGKSAAPRRGYFHGRCRPWQPVAPIDRTGPSSHHHAPLLLPVGIRIICGKSVLDF